jgi:hypothetical protein
MRSKLKLEEVSVESFELGVTRSTVGTVRAHESDGGQDDGGQEIGTGMVSCGSTCSTCPTGMGPNCCV